MAFGLVILTCIIIYFIGLGGFGITDPGESYYAEAGREMLEMGDYVTPHLNYQIYFSKPILTFWLVVLGYKLFGVSEFGARIVFAVLALLTVLSTYWVSRQITNWRMGLMAALITATAPLMVVMSRLSPIDIAFSCFLNLAVFAIVLTCLMGETVYWPVIYVSLALAVLSKGPAALVLVGLGTLAFIASERAPLEVYTKRIERAHIVLGGLIFSIIALPWYLAVGTATQGLFLKVFFLYENLARFAGHTNLAKGTWWRYFPTLIYSFFPWVLCLGQSFRQAFVLGRSASHYVENHDAPITEQQERNGASAILFLACYSLAILVFFSLSRTQLDTYLLPIVPPLAVLVANYFEAELKRADAHAGALPTVGLTLRWVSWPFLLLGCLSPAACLAGLSRIVQLDIRYGVIAVAAIICVGWIAQYWLYRKHNYFAMLGTIFGACVLASAVGSQTAFQILDASGQHQLRIICQRHLKADDRLAIFQGFKPSIMFYCRRPVDSFFHVSQIIPDSTPKVDETVKRKVRLLIIASNQAAIQLKQSHPANLRLIEQSSDWSIWQLVDARLEKLQTLETIFKGETAFSQALSGQADFGPLTVPYAGGVASH